eukprot:scaffold6407_cov62-Phaeocystis_antarctica.AAC.5
MQTPATLRNRYNKPLTTPQKVLHVTHKNIYVGFRRISQQHNANYTPFFSPHGRQETKEVPLTCRKANEASSAVPAPESLSAASEGASFWLSSLNLLLCHAWNTRDNRQCTSPCLCRGAPHTRTHQGLGDEPGQTLRELRRPPPIPPPLALPAPRACYTRYIVYWLENLYGDATRIYPVPPRPLGD